MFDPDNTFKIGLEIFMSIEFETQFKRKQKLKNENFLSRRYHPHRCSQRIAAGDEKTFSNFRHQ